VAYLVTAEKDGILSARECVAICGRSCRTYGAASYVRVEAMPLLPSGKVHRKLCRKREESPIGAGIGGGADGSGTEASGDLAGVAEIKEVGVEPELF